MVLDKQFFPTPPEVLKLMVAPYVSKYETSIRNPRGENIRLKALDGFGKTLDSSAGTGHILDYLVEKHGARPKSLYAIEIVPEFRSALQVKGYNVIGSNIFEFDDPYTFDTIIINPPFADGAKHLLKSWEMVADGGLVVCVLNAETITNPYSSERKIVANLIEQYGSVEFIGRAFSNAERATNVECAIVRLNKPKRAKGWEFSGIYEKETPVEVAQSYSDLAPADLLAAIVAQYNAAKQALINEDLHSRALAYYTQGITSVYAIEKFEDINQKISKLKAVFWKMVFDRTKIGRVTTAEYQKKFRQYEEQAGMMAFTRENIEEVLFSFYENRQQIMMECIEAVFDRLTTYHKKNRVHKEGWVSNKGWMVSQKIVLPFVVEASFGNHWLMKHNSNGEVVDDLDKAISFIAGVSADEIKTVRKAFNDHIASIVRQGSEVSYSDEFESEFFFVRVYKKGTMHIRFKDEKIWAEFNRQAAGGKTWVGDGNK